MAKIERKYLAHFINTAMTGEASYERLGEDLEQFSPRLCAQVETRKNILGQTNVVISGYEKTGTVEPFYAREGSALFERLQDIIDNQLAFEQLKTDVVEVKLWQENDEGVYAAVCQEAYIEVVSYGGDMSGCQIAFKLHYTGATRKGSFDVNTAAFTPA